jgi:hypothetical protein
VAFETRWPASGERSVNASGLRFSAQGFIDFFELRNSVLSQLMSFHYRAWTSYEGITEQFQSQFRRTKNVLLRFSSSTLVFPCTSVLSPFFTVSSFNQYIHLHCHYYTPIYPNSQPQNNHPATSTNSYTNRMYELNSFSPRHLRQQALY